MSATSADASTQGQGSPTTAGTVDANVGVAIDAGAPGATNQGSSSGANGGVATATSGDGAVTGAIGGDAGYPRDAGAAGDAGASAAEGGAGGDSARAPASCARSGPGLDSCGPQADESCCVSLPVEGGMYDRTYTSSGRGGADPATVSAFRLDKYELTVGRFRQFVNYLVAGGAPPAAGSGKHTHLNAGKGLADSGKNGGFETGWDPAWNTNIPSGASAGAQWATKLNCSAYATWSQSAGNNEGLPLTCMDWYEAYAFCIWDGGFLPSEAEWEYAAAGGAELRKYPWGSDDPGTQSQYAMYDCYYPTGRAGNCTGLTNIAKVGSTPKGLGRYGQLDLAGSVWEWCLDQFAPYANPCADCAYLSGATNRVLPGGGFHTGLSPYLLSANRVGVDYATTYRGTYGVGVRCARAP
jgi:formylglycine-generating enzyme required for sulfatase activity